jgi:SCP-2 sterol transfer family
VENIADSKNAREYRKKVSDPETVSLWQSLGFGPNYKAAYCMSVCPAGEGVIAPFLTRRQQFLQEVVKPLQNKKETVYVVPGSDAEAHVARRFPHKKVKQVGNGLRPSSIEGFLKGLSWVFQRGKSEGLEATYHFTFTGQEERKATITIRDQSLKVEEGHQGQPNLRVTADSRTWLRFVAKELNIVWALLRRKIRIKGSPRLLLAFGRCFPS